MNTAIFSPSGGSVGIGFAIPSDMVRTVVANWWRRACHPRLYRRGGAAVSQAMAKAMHLPETSGALLASVEPDRRPQGGPAAGRRHRGGERPENQHAARSGVDRGQRDSRAMRRTCRILRDGQDRDIDGEDRRPCRTRRPRAPGPRNRRRMASSGSRLAALTPEIRQQLDIPNGIEGRGRVATFSRAHRPTTPACIRVT